MLLKTFVNRLSTGSVVGLDLGSSCVKAVEVASSATGPVLRRCTVTTAASGNGASALPQFLRDAQVATVASVAVGIASPELIVKPVQFPALSRKELAGAIRLEAEQAILNGHTLEEMAIDWHPLASSNGHRESLRGLLAVVPKALVTNRLTPLIAAGVRAAVIDVEGLALWNAYWTLIGRREPAEKVVLLINVGARTTNLVMVKGQDELALLRDLGLGGMALQAGRQAEWLEELRDSLAYARAKSGLRTLDAVYLTGGGSEPSLAASLQSLTTADVTLGNPLANLARDDKSPAVDESLGPLLAIAIGLALRRPA